MKVTRRQILETLGVGAPLIAGSAWVYGTLWRFGAPAVDLAVLTRDEFAVLEKISEAFFPGPPSSPLSATEVELPRFVDRYLGQLYEQEARLFRTLFRAVNLAPVLSHGRSFYWLPLAARQSVLEGWSKSRFKARRAGYSSLRFVHALGYFEDDRVREALEHRFGCDLAGRNDRALRDG